MNFPKLLGKYRIVQHIANGSNSFIFQVVDVNTDQKYACKVFIHSQLINNGKIEDIEKEVNILRLLDSDYIIKIEDFFIIDDLLCIVLEYCDRGDLYTYILHNSPLPEYEIIRIFKQILAGLDYLHKCQVVHRDIKPENILLDQNLDIKICDFDCASCVSPSALLSDQKGSLYYTAPEVIRHVPYDGYKADIWSLGIIIYLMITGTLPWKDGHTSGIVKQITSCNINIPSNTTSILQEVLREMLQQDPTNRPSACLILSKIDTNSSPIKCLKRKKIDVCSKSKRRTITPAIFIPKNAIVSSSFSSKLKQSRLRANSTN